MQAMQTVWGWQPALYLFLGGLGAGSFVAAAALYLVKRDSRRKVACFTSWASIVFLSVGLLLLLSELNAPMRGLMMWQSFSNTTSWMAVGAWLLFATIIVFAFSAVSLTEGIVGRIEFSRGSMARGLRTARVPLLIAGIVLGMGVAVYTGILLFSSEGIPLWNSVLLPCLFTVSALGTGLAFTEIVVFFDNRRTRAVVTAVAGASFEEGSHEVVKIGEHRALSIAALALTLVEAAVLAGYLASMYFLDASTGASASSAVTSANEVMFGTFGQVFWGLVVVCGLVVPVVCALAGVVFRREVPGLPLVGACGAIVGGCALRFVVLLAGAHADLIAEAVSRLAS